MDLRKQWNLQWNDLEDSDSGNATGKQKGHPCFLSNPPEIPHWPPLTRRRWSMVHSRSSSSNAWQMMRSRLWTIAGKDGQLCTMWHESFRMVHHFYHDTVWMKRPVGPHWYRIQVWENWTKNVMNTLAKWRASTWNFPYFTAILKV